MRDGASSAHVPAARRRYRRAQGELKEYWRSTEHGAGGYEVVGRSGNRGVVESEEASGLLGGHEGPKKLSGGHLQYLT